MSKADAKVARRYAKALFENSNPQNYDAVLKSLKDLASSFSEPSIRSALLDPSLPQDERLRWVLEVVSMSCPAESKSLGNFMDVMLQNRRTDSLAMVADFFANMLAQYKKLLALEVTSARTLSEEDRQALASKVKSQLPSHLAEGVKFDWRTESDLIGGMQVSIGDKMLDGSVSGAINKIARQLRTQ